MINLLKKMIFKIIFSPLLKYNGIYEKIKFKYRKYRRK